MKALFHHPLAGRPLVDRPLARHPLARKLAIVTAIKLAGLFLLWWAFFSGHGHPAMTADQAADALLHHQVGNAGVGGIETSNARVSNTSKQARRMEDD